MIKLTPKPLTPEAFASYGDVVSTETASKSFGINYGLTTRFHDLANVDVTDEGGKAGFSIFRATPLELPHNVKVMEYHPKGSQLFYPLNQSPFLILVAPPSKLIDINKLELFHSDGTQGVNYNKGTWHHFLIALEDNSDFVVIDRLGDDDNCVEEEFSAEVVLSK